jgi:hypothetical protein
LKVKIENGNSIMKSDLIRAVRAIKAEIENTKLTRVLEILALACEFDGLEIPSKYDYLR